MALDPHWGIFDNCPDGNSHVMPIDAQGYNVMAHEPSMRCWCRPTVQHGLIVHVEPLWPGSNDPMPTFH